MLTFPEFLVAILILFSVFGVYAWGQFCKHGEEKKERSGTVKVDLEVFMKMSEEQRERYWEKLEKPLDEYERIAFPLKEEDEE